jgi:hypothetical protein
MELLGFLLVFGLFFAGIVCLLFWFAWRRLRMIAIVIPQGSDPQAFRFQLTEAIRSLGFRPNADVGPSAEFRAPAWQKWAVGLQDISVSPSGSGMIRVTGPALNVSLIGRRFAGVIPQPYEGHQSAWPLVKGVLRLMAIPIGLAVVGGLALYLVSA